MIGVSTFFSLCLERTVTFFIFYLILFLSVLSTLETTSNALASDGGGFSSLLLELGLKKKCKGRKGVTLPIRRLIAAQRPTPKRKWDARAACILLPSFGKAVCVFVRVESGVRGRKI